MCALPVLVWTCLAMFCGLQPHFFATPPVFYLVTNNHHFAGMSSMVCHHSILRHPQYRPPGFRYFITTWCAPSTPITQIFFVSFFELFCCCPACPVLSWPSCPLQCSTNTCCVTSPRPHLAQLLGLHTRTNSVIMPLLVSCHPYQYESGPLVFCRMDTAFLWLDSHRQLCGHGLPSVTFFAHLGAGAPSLTVDLTCMDLSIVSQTGAHLLAVDLTWSLATQHLVCLEFLDFVSSRLVPIPQLCCFFLEWGFFFLSRPACIPLCAFFFCVLTLSRIGCFHGL
jgi:hypothetical protein